MKNIIESIKTQNKIRGINKYTNQLISADETLNFILKCYKMVSENFKIVNSQYDFSKIFLDCNKYFNNHLLTMMLIIKKSMLYV